MAQSYIKLIEYTYSPDNVWFTSDTHFGHKNIIRFCGRPFRDVNGMDEELIRRWNKTVPKNGIVFHLGGFCNGNSREWNKIMSRLNGKVYHYSGNYDIRYIHQNSAHSFELATQQMCINVGGQSIILNHNPFLCYGGVYSDVWQLFGHVHSDPCSNTGLDETPPRVFVPPAV